MKICYVIFQMSLNMKIKFIMKNFFKITLNEIEIEYFLWFPIYSLKRSSMSKISKIWIESILFMLYQVRHVLHFEDAYF